MADEASKSASPFDVQTIKQLITLMSRHDLSEIDLREGSVRVRLRRGSNAPSPTIALPPQILAPTAGPPAAGAAASAAPPAAEPDKPAKNLISIKSPTPGTFYSCPSPGAKPFVEVGSRVAPTTVVCTIEAMKLFNEIPAECAGVIAEVCVENQQPVEYGQVLFKVDPTL